MSKATKILAGIVALLGTLVGVGDEAQAQTHLYLELHAQPTEAVGEIRVVSRQGSPPFDTIHPGAGALLLTVALDAGWRTDVDVVGRTVDGNRSMFLRFTRAHVGTRQRATFHHHGARPTSLQHADEMERLKRQGDEQSLLEAYARGREGCDYWWVANRTHTAGIRACKVWFDSAYELARRVDLPYRMDPRARESMEWYEQEAATNPAFNRQYRRVVREGYIRGMLRQLDALSFRELSLVGDLVQDGEYGMAWEANEQLRLDWESLSAELRSTVTELQGVSAAQLDANRSYLLTLRGEG